MQAVILLAGEGTRMRPLTYTTPKPLLKVAGKTILEHNLESLSANGIKNVILVVGYMQEQIKKFLENFQGFNLKFASQNERLGTGHALLQAENMVEDEKFLVMYGDDVYDQGDIRKCLNNEICVTAKEVDYPESFGVFVVEQNRVRDLIEKPQTFVSNLANTGLYMLNKEVFPILQNLKISQRNEFELTDAIAKLAEKIDVKCEITDKWLPIGYPWDLLTANESKMINVASYTDPTTIVDRNVTIEGNVKIGKNTKIKNGAYIVGPVIIGDNCVIGPNCYIRPSSFIGNNCKIGNSVEIKNSIIGDYTNIEHLAYVGDSIIGTGSNLGAGTVVANLRHDNLSIRVNVKEEVIDSRKKKLGVIMGDYSKTGVKTSIYPGVMIGPFSWTLPGSVISKGLSPFTLDGEKYLDENKFDSRLIEKIRLVKELMKK